MISTKLLKDENSLGCELASEVDACEQACMQLELRMSLPNLIKVSTDFAVEVIS